MHGVECRTVDDLADFERVMFSRGLMPTTIGSALMPRQSQSSSDTRMQGHAQRYGCIGMLTAHDLHCEIEFYTNLLGFVCEQRTPGFAILRRGEMELRFVHCRLSICLGGCVCNLRVEVKALHRELLI